MNTSIGDRAAFWAGWALALCDTLWGGALSGWFDWSRPHEAWLAIGFLLGLPAYVLDLLRPGRVLVFLPAAVVTRWVAQSYADSHLALVPPWQSNLLLIAAGVLLQWSKLRTGGSARWHH